VEFYKSHTEKPALVLLDVNMPVMGGKEAFKQIREINPAARIIILTGYGRETIEAADFGSKVNAFMQTPFHLETLAMTVRQILDDSTVDSTSDQPAALGA
jgi:CheY-like chemotaxis protein